MNNARFSAFQPRSGHYEVKRHVTSPIEIKDNYITVPVGRDVLEPPENLPKPVASYVVSHLTFKWCMYGGRDFDSSPATKTSNKTQRALQNKR